MEYGLNDIVEMKKQHPCGTNRCCFFISTISFKQWNMV